MSRPRTPLPRLRSAALAAVVANVGIVFTGGIVRVTGSGLGCSDWPTCDGSSLVPTGEGEVAWHSYVEFGNRLLTFVLLAVGVWLWRRVRQEAPERRDLKLLALSQTGGVFGQAILGGITVLTDLHPLAVASHFLLSMVLLAAAVVLRSRVSDDAADHPDGAGRPLRMLVRALPVSAAVVLVLGTVVTATGPHAGDADVARWGGLDIRTAAFLHADAVWLLVGLSLATLLVAHVVQAEAIRRAAIVLLVVEVAQGAIGYGQYALGIPAELVSMHLVGACLLWIAALRVPLALAVPAADALDHATLDPVPAATT